ncbi:MAG: cation-transporting P-type ATPase [Rhodobacter sp.]|nr:cation-transporting P-type ATPase [Rhodobacter sp.]
MQDRIDTDRNGLTADAVALLRETHGWNELPRGRRVSPLRVFARQFKGLLILILILAAGVAFVLGETVDTAAIGLVILLNGILGFVQEWRAETALEALKSMLSPQAVVIRDGREQVVEARELVPGDLVLLEAGDRVPADLTLVYGVQLKLDESVLTGESVPVARHHTDDDAKLMTGTAVVDGRAEGRVRAIGSSTAFGQIAELTGSVGEKETNIQRKLGLLARQLGAAALVIAVVILMAGLAAGRDLLEMFMTGLSLAVAVVPEGLPAVVTITLALGARAMARQKALARRLQAVEGLGAATVICTDKTGTLTENKMTVTEIWMPDAVYQVTGTGYDPQGHISRDGARVRAADDPGLGLLLESAVTCNHARLHRGREGWEMVGDPTEGALVTLAYKGWVAAPDPADTLQELPFSSARKRMSVLARTGDHCSVFTKGAPEVVLAASASVVSADGVAPMTEADRDAVRDAYRDMAGRGLRVIALAVRPVERQEIVEDELVFLGLAGMIDPPRPEVRAAVAGAQAAGIRVIMITGDGPVTAAAIAEQVGIGAESVLSGEDLDGMDDAALTAALQGPVVFARVHPGDKMRIVRALQATRQIVAMTGDGVNDAPALKQADIGVAMGVRGTEVAKDASDLVLLDDNFATIVKAIREGRRQFDNVRKFVRYLLSSNAGEVIAILVNILIGGPLVFLATQILWMNLVTDGVTAVALGVEKAEADQMKRPPRAKDAPVLGLPGLSMILMFGAYTSTASLGLFYYLLPQGEDLARTAAFTAMVVFEKASVFAFRSLTLPCWRIGWFSNPLLLAALVLTLLAQVAAVYMPPLQVLLHTVPLGGEAWLMIAALALPLILVPELVATVMRWR